MFKKKKDLKFSIDLSSRFLDKLIFAIFSENSLVNRKFLSKVKQFIEILDMEAYARNKEKFLRLEFIAKSIELILDRGLRDFYIITEELANRTEFHEEYNLIIDEICNNVVSNEDVLFLDEFLTYRLKWLFIYEHYPDLKDILYQFETNEFSNFEDVIEDFFDVIEDLYYKKRQVEIKNKDERFDFNIKDQETFRSNIEDGHRNITSERNTIRTGLKSLNKMLNGGFRAGKLYCFFAVPGMWKSGMLLNICMWALKYNHHIKPDDPTRIPTVVYISLENSRDETLERIASHISPEVVDGVDFKEYSTPQLLNLFMNNPELVSSNLDFAFRYRRSNSISTADIENIVNEVENEVEPSSKKMREVVLLVVDYLGRLQPNSKVHNGETYLVYGNVSDDLSSFAKFKNIPVVTAHQLNRQADDTIHKISQNNKADIGKHLGRANISDSRRILEVIDDGMIILPEEHPVEKNTWLYIGGLKHRGRKKKVQPFYQKFLNGMRLEEDADYPENKSVPSLIDNLIEKDISHNMKYEVTSDEVPQVRKRRSPLDEFKELDDYC